MQSYVKWILVALAGAVIGMIAAGVFLRRPPSEIPQPTRAESVEASPAPDSAPGTQRHYSPLAERFSEQLYLRRELLLDDVPGQVFSPNGMYWYGVFNPEPVDPGLCALDGAVYVHTGKGQSLRLEFRNHRAVPEVRWINDKLLYFEVRWGELLGAYAVLDVELEELLVREMFTEGESASREIGYERSPPSKRN